jgi:hypothetical protein
MKNLIASILTPSLFIVLLFAGTARAQFEHHVIRVSVPFEFTIGEKSFPSGYYSLVRTAPVQFDLRDSNAHVLTSVLTHSVQSQKGSRSTRLEFSTAFGGHALTQVWVENENIGYELAAVRDTSLVAKRRSHESTRSAGAGTK